jgi:hypothetical protein
MHCGISLCQMCIIPGSVFPRHEIRLSQLVLCMWRVIAALWHLTVSDVCVVPGSVFPCHEIRLSQLVLCVWHVIDALWHLAVSDVCHTRQCLPAPWDYLDWPTLCCRTRTCLQCHVWYTFMKLVHVALSDFGTLWDVCTTPSVGHSMTVLCCLISCWAVQWLCCGTEVLCHVIRWYGISTLYLRNV